MTVIACDNEEFEHAIQMSTPSTHYGQMASEPKNPIHAKSEKDTAQYNTPLHTLDMQIDLPIIISQHSYWKSKNHAQKYFYKKPRSLSGKCQEYHLPWEEGTC